MLTAGCGVPELGAPTGLDPGLYASRSYSLMRPPSTARRLIRSWLRSATGDRAERGYCRDRRLIDSWEGPVMGSSGYGDGVGGCDGEGFQLSWASFSAGSTAGGDYRRSASGGCLGPGDERGPFGVGVRASRAGSELARTLSVPARGFGTQHLPPGKPQLTWEFSFLWTSAYGAVCLTAGEVYRLGPGRGCIAFQKVLTCRNDSW
jgi:hypothetical protein